MMKKTGFRLLCVFFCVLMALTAVCRVFPGFVRKGVVSFQPARLC